MNGADIMAKSLKAEGVKRLFGYPGVAICPFFDALTKTDIEKVLVRQEQSAAHMASGYARVTGEVGVCVVTSGPGALNLITGIATAFMDSIPLICITGQVTSALIGSDSFQEADITGAVESFVKYSYLVRDVADLPRIMKEAFYIANSGRKGPVLIDVPIDIQQAAFTGKFKYPEEVSMRTYKPTVEGNVAQIKKVIKEIKKAKRPILCVGGGVFLSGAVKEIRAFARDNHIPVVSTMMGIGVMPTDDPLYFGMVGNHGRACANRAMNESDLLLMVGARVADRSVNRPELIRENKTLVHIDVDPAEIGKNVGPTIPLVGDIKHIFEVILKVEDIDDDHAKWIETLKGYKETMIAPQKGPRSGDYVDPREFLNGLSDMMRNDGVFVCDVGQNQIWSAGFFRVSEKGRFMTSGGMGTMGYSVPAAIGAKFANEKRQVVSVCGEGGFQMTMQELGVIAHYGVDVRIAVFRNNVLGLVHEYQHHSCKRNFTMVDLGDEPNLSLIAEAYGLRYRHLTGGQDLREALDFFLNEPGACIMEVDIDPEDLVIQG